MTWGWLYRYPSLQPYGILQCVSQYSVPVYAKNAIGQKISFSHSLAITRDPRNEDREKSSAQTLLCNNIWTTGAMDRTSAPPKVKLSFLRINSLKIGPQVKRHCSLGGNGGNSRFSTNLLRESWRDIGQVFFVLNINRGGILYSNYSITLILFGITIN